MSLRGNLKSSYNKLRQLNAHSSSVLEQVLNRCVKRKAVSLTCAAADVCKRLATHLMSEY